MGATLGPARTPTGTDDIFEEIRRVVPGYQVSLANLLAGGAEPVLLSAGSATHRPDGSGRVESAQDTLFTSGTLGRYSRILNLVPEKETRKRSESV
jgi:NADH-quinone oxidoreductase subunit G